MADHTKKEEIIEALKNLSEQLGQKRLTKQDVAKVFPVSTIEYHFGSLGNALEAAGLERTNLGDNLRGRGAVLTVNELFQNLFEIEEAIGREPRSNDCRPHGKFSTRPYKQFGEWNDVLAHYRKWKVETDVHVSSIVIQEEQPAIVAQVPENDPRPVIVSALSTRKTPSQLYGEPIDFRGLRHAPINEQGVVFFFGMVSRELGFSIEAVQQGFPDCEGKYLYDTKKNLWAKARIEFECRSSSFQQHGHNADQCDFIVCWIDDWPECPIEVIELKTRILKLPSR